MNAQQITQVKALTGLYQMIGSASLISADDNCDALAIGAFVDAFDSLAASPPLGVVEVNRRYVAAFNSGKALAGLIEAERVQIIASYHGGLQ